MTTLNLTTQDQRLTYAEKVTLASGDINSVILQVEFDTYWDSFPARTATFYTLKKPSEVYEVLMTQENTCIIPGEVLTEQGTLNIGIRGATLDGETIKTSSIAKYNIVPGASRGTLTLAPAKDLYMQYLEAIKKKTDPFYADIMTFLDEYEAQTTAQINTVIDRIKESIEGVELWKNIVVESNFPAQDIALDLTDYSKVRIIFRRSPSGDSYTEFTYTQKNIKVVANFGSESNDYGRELMITDKKISFYDAYQVEGNPNDMYLIPYKIIGYKTVPILT